MDVPSNLEARRRITFFANSLFMAMSILQKSLTCYHSRKSFHIFAPALFYIHFSAPYLNSSDTSFQLLCLYLLTIKKLNVSNGVHISPVYVATFLICVLDFVIGAAYQLLYIIFWNSITMLRMLDIFWYSIGICLKIKIIIQLSL